MRGAGLLLLLVACAPQAHLRNDDAGAGGDAASNTDAVDSAPDAAVAPNYGERCGNGIDDDGDGLIDEDCAPSLFAGVWVPAVAADPALSMIETATARPLSVIQTYRSSHAAEAPAITSDLAAIFARGQIAHLNIEPSGYTADQYAAPTADPVASDLSTMASAIASALAAAPAGRVILTFGAEMNGNWTDWGCLTAAHFIALYRAAHDAVLAALAASGIDARRVRWAYGPNATSSASCGSAAGYYPGHAYVDLLGLSAYRSGTATVSDAVLTPMASLFSDLAYPVAWQHDRFVVLQTGTRDVAGDDRDAWIADLTDRLTADDRAAGFIYFDDADWAVATNGDGWAGLTTSIAAMPVADRGLAGVFEPFFFDVPYTHPAFGEIQALRDHGVTSGCAAAPAQFCPDAMLLRADAMTMLARAFPGGSPVLPAADPVQETELVGAITALGGVATDATAIPTTRARAAVLIARGARLSRAPL
jgi:hypothetical protein